MQAPSEVLGVWTSAKELGGDTVQPQTMGRALQGAGRREITALSPTRLLREMLAGSLPPARAQNMLALPQGWRLLAASEGGLPCQQPCLVSRCRSQPSRQEQQEKRLKRITEGWERNCHPVTDVTPVCVPQPHSSVQGALRGAVGLGRRGSAQRRHRRGCPASTVAPPPDHPHHPGGVQPGGRGGQTGLTELGLLGQ